MLCPHVHVMCAQAALLHCCIQLICYRDKAQRTLQALARAERDLQLARRDVQMLRQERREAQQAQDRVQALEKELAGLSGSQEELVKAEKVPSLPSPHLDNATRLERRIFTDN